MIALLASVACCDEIDAALSGGADIIDLKDPRMGALGAWKIESIREAVGKLKGRRPVSATIGDLPLQPEIIAAAVRAAAETGVDIVKIGFFDGSTQACIAALEPVAGRTHLVAVLFADRSPDFDLLPALAKAGFFGVMLDTADKSRGTLCDHMDRYALAQFGALARTQQLRFGLAGSLAMTDIPPLLSLSPDFLGFRRALCGAADRTGKLDSAAVANVKRAIETQIPDARTATATAGAQIAVSFRAAASTGTKSAKSA